MVLIGAGLVSLGVGLYGYSVYLQGIEVYHTTHRCVGHEELLTRCPFADINPNVGWEIGLGLALILNSVIFGRRAGKQQKNINAG
jgi:hypothetical protein